jgi:predicted helicase
MTAKVFHAHLWGKREEKYAALEEKDISTIEWTEIEPESPFYLFIPQDKGAWKEYQKGWSLPDIFPVNVLGFQTHRDSFAIAFTRSEIEERVADMRNAAISDEELRQEYNLKDNRDWQLAEARKQARLTKADDVIRDCLYRPFDVRPSYFSFEAMDYPRRELMDHVAEKDSLCLLSSRQQGFIGFRHIFVADSPANDCVVSNRTKESNQCFPLYTYPSEQKGQGDLLAVKEKQPNFAQEFVEVLSSKLDLPFDAQAHRGIHTPRGHDPNCPGTQSPQGGVMSPNSGSCPPAWNPEDLFCYAYAVFHSPTYRERYAEFLKIDFPRLPLTSDKALFFRLADLGEELVRLHLMRESRGHVTSTCPPDSFVTGFPHSGNNEVVKISYKDGCVWFNADQCFEGVEEADWNFHIGGYQVLSKWLKDRKGRTLSFDDIEHYQKIVAAIHETRRLMAEIDQTIPQWPIQ